MTHRIFLCFVDLITLYDGLVTLRFSYAPLLRRHAMRNSSRDGNEHDGLVKHGQARRRFAHGASDLVCTPPAAAVWSLSEM